MKLGDHMVRVDDGQRGIVAQNGPELRIVYQDRGEERVALKSEKWVHDEYNPGPLRDEEKHIIAQAADKALRAIETHTPYAYWEPPQTTWNVYDDGLVTLIVAYLTAREPR